MRREGATDLDKWERLPITPPILSKIRSVWDGRAGEHDISHVVGSLLPGIFWLSTCWGIDNTE